MPLHSEVRNCYPQSMRWFSRARARFTEVKVDVSTESALARSFAFHMVFNSAMGACMYAKNLEM